MSRIHWTDPDRQRPAVPQRIVELQRQLTRPAPPLEGAPPIRSKREQRRLAMIKLPRRNRGRRPPPAT